MPQTSKRALIVDDSPANRVALGVLLGQFSIDVTHATSGAEAIRLYEEDPTFDLVVVNVEMSGVNGFTTAKLIRQYQRAKRPYVVGIASSLENSEKALGAGMDFYAVKPFEISKFTNVVQLHPRKL